MNIDKGRFNDKLVSYQNSLKSFYYETLQLMAVYLVVYEKEKYSQSILNIVKAFLSFDDHFSPGEILCKNSWHFIIFCGDNRKLKKLHSTRKKKHRKSIIQLYNRKNSGLILSIVFNL